MIGDNPAVTIGTDFTTGVAFGDAQALVRPIGPKHMLALVLGRDNIRLTIPRTLVDRLNTVQVNAANRYVYMQPGSDLKAFTERAAQQRPAGEPTT
ncbi:DUF4238 domain-containing protein [Streptomyces bobili]|uniref:DUF4238 domain-containing protein n=1 Tax=Streptomyces bobili TaxID=67280 RepID=UPI00382F123E